jgi:glutaminyl-tRNA synthetase
MSAPSSDPSVPERSLGSPGNFIDDRITEESKSHKVRVHTRFPPEPNGFLHIGHAKSICLNFGLAKKFGGKCNLRFDDTNPETEETLFVRSIEEDVRWLGFEWDTKTYYASDYFEQLHDFAVTLIKKGKAYVDSRSLDEIRATRGDFYKPGEDSPHRNRSVDENLDLFARMKKGEFPDGAHVLRAKIDMTSEDVKLRDPVMYRIRRAHHHRTGDTWCIYPMYDWAHGQSDAIEGITHSICTLEFVNHRPLYHWFLDALALAHHPEQIEFARLNLTYTVLSKRKLQELVKDKHVNGWDDPRMPTLAGLRRRGYTKEAIQAFCERVGVSTRDSVVDVSLLEHALREDLNATSPRVMAVLRPLKVTIENMPEDAEEVFDAPYDPEKPDGPSRKVYLSRELWIEQDDFMEVPAKKWFRLAPGQEVRLRYACLFKCTSVVKNDKGEVVEVRGTWDPASRGGASPDGRKVKGTIHWVSAKRALTAEVRLYDRLFQVENPLKDKDTDFKVHMNPASLEVLRDCKLEPALAGKKPLERVQFERIGYFVVDPDTREGRPVYNRTIGLKDSWAAQASKASDGA